jgi:hypothetical protein
MYVQLCGKNFYKMIIMYHHTGQRSAFMDVKINQYVNINIYSLNDLSKFILNSSIWRFMYRPDDGPICWVKVKVKVKQSHWQALRVPAGWSSQILTQSARESDKVFSLTHRPHLLPGNIPSTHFCYKLSRPKGHITPSGIDPATFRFAGQCMKT